MIYFKVFGWFNVGLGTLGVFGSLDPFDGLGFVACVLWMINGFAILNLTDRVEAKESK